VQGNLERIRCMTWQRMMEVSAARRGRTSHMVNLPVAAQFKWAHEGQPPTTTRAAPAHGPPAPSALEGEAIAARCEWERGSTGCAASKPVM
jgi:hypothetical protein